MYSDNMASSLHWVSVNKYFMHWGDLVNGKINANFFLGFISQVSKLRLDVLLYYAMCDLVQCVVFPLQETAGV